MPAIHDLALWFGYALMVAGSVAVLLGALWLVAECCFRVREEAAMMRYEKAVRLAATDSNNRQISRTQP